jgi:hypothetical protein
MFQLQQVSFLCFMMANTTQKKLCMFTETYICPYGDHGNKKIKQSKPYLQQRKI